MGTKRKSDDFGQKVWSQSLLKSLEDPNLKVKEDDRIIVIKDKYPKAKYHYLVCPKKDVAMLKKLTEDDIELLQHMDEVGREVAKKHEGVKFYFGYHAVPSLTRLHMHVISDDLVSPCLKIKKHWNSFTTDFFLPSEKVIEGLKTQKKEPVYSLEYYKNLLSAPLKCHKCSFKPKTLPDLKNHLLIHM